MPMQASRKSGTDTDPLARRVRQVQESWLMLRFASVAAVLAVGATADYAQNVAVIKERQKLYESQGNAGKLPKLFPDDSKTGGDTEALPAIWENKKDFEERFLKLADAAKAAETAISDEATFKRSEEHTSE